MVRQRNLGSDELTPTVKRILSYFNDENFSIIAKKIGLSSQTVSNFAQGRTKIPVELLQYIADHGGDTNYILTGHRVAAAAAPDLPDAVLRIGEVWNKLTDDELRTLLDISAAAQARERQKNSV